MDELRKVQIRTDLEELSAKGHLTQREMKIAVEVLGNLFEYIGELEKELEEAKKNFVTFDDDDLKGLASKLSKLEGADAGTVGLALEPVKNVEAKDFDIPIEGDAEEDEEDG